MSVMRWWSAAFFFFGLAGGFAAFFLLGLVGAVGFAVVFFLGLRGACFTRGAFSGFRLGLRTALGSSSCSSSNATRSAFLPVVLSPRFESSSFSSATFRDDQSLVAEGLFSLRLLFRDDDEPFAILGDGDAVAAASSSDSGREAAVLAEEEVLRLPRWGRLRRGMLLLLLLLLSSVVARKNNRVVDGSLRDGIPVGKKLVGYSA